MPLNLHVIDGYADRPVGQAEEGAAPVLSRRPVGADEAGPPMLPRRSSEHDVGSTVARVASIRPSPFLGPATPAGTPKLMPSMPSITYRLFVTLGAAEDFIGLPDLVSHTVSVSHPGQHVLSFRSESGAVAARDFLLRRGQQLGPVEVVTEVAHGDVAHPLSSMLLGTSASSGSSVGRFTPPQWHNDVTQFSLPSSYTSGFGNSPAIGPVTQLGDKNEPSRRQLGFTPQTVLGSLASPALTAVQLPPRHSSGVLTPTSIDGSPVMSMINPPLEGSGDARRIRAPSQPAEAAAFRGRGGSAGPSPDLGDAVTMQHYSEAVAMMRRNSLLMTPPFAATPHEGGGPFSQRRTSLDAGVGFPGMPPPLSLNGSELSAPALAPPSSFDSMRMRVLKQHDGHDGPSQTMFASPHDPPSNKRKSSGDGGMLGEGVFALTSPALGPQPALAALPHPPLGMPGLASDDVANIAAKLAEAIVSGSDLTSLLSQAQALATSNANARTRLDSIAELGEGDVSEADGAESATLPTPLALAEAPPSPFTPQQPVTLPPPLPLGAPTAASAELSRDVPSDGEEVCVCPCRCSSPLLSPSCLLSSPAGTALCGHKARRAAKFP